MSTGWIYAYFWRRIGNPFINCRTVFSKVKTIKETEVMSRPTLNGSISYASDYSIRLFTLLFSLKKLDVCFRVSGPQIETTFHQVTHSWCVKIKNALRWKMVTWLTDCNALNCIFLFYWYLGFAISITSRCYRSDPAEIWCSCLRGPFGAFFRITKIIYFSILFFKIFNLQGGRRIYFSDFGMKYTPCRRIEGDESLTARFWENLQILL